MSIETFMTASLLASAPLSFSFTRRRNPLHGLALSKVPPTGKTNLGPGSGLRTPPVDDMSATYRSAMPAYDGRNLHSYSMALPHTGHGKGLMGDARNSQQHRHVSQRTQAQNGLYAPAVQMPEAVPYLSTGPVTPATDPLVSNNSGSRRASETLIYHSLQLPKCVSPTGGSLSDFAAQMTCLFWFESVDELQNAETIRSRPPQAFVSRLPPLARPHEQFQKWVYNVLSTTQVTQNVIFLALLFIYRLKMSTPSINGRAGSEYRLLTVALMLGNKFLDDNTYTNKTWAEVSCFSVQEIHVMEVEFLSNMRYNLLASKQEWEQWILKLSCFHEFYERASKLPISPVHKSPPTLLALHSPPIPSPTTPGCSAFPSLKTNPSAVSGYSQGAYAYQANASSPLASKVAAPLPSSRKRSPDGDLAEHPAKRHLTSASGQQQPSTATPSVRLNGSLDQSRLSLPHLTLVTNHPYATVSGHGHNPAPAQQVVSLPPMQPGTRAMSTVYQPNHAGGMVQPHTMGPATSASSMPASAYPASLPTPTPIGYGTPTKHHSPGRLAHNFGSSPLAESFGPVSAVHTPVIHTPMSNSPSVYLQHRASPYKPIRHVNRLLYPPSSSLDQYHFAVPVQPNQMHYQPLGRRNELRTGIVPEFLLYNRRQQQQLPHGSQQGTFPS